MSFRESIKTASAKELYSNAYALYEAEKYEEVMRISALLKTKYPKSKETRWATKNFKKCDPEYRKRYPIILLHWSWKGPLLIVLFRIIGKVLIQSPACPASASAIHCLGILSDYRRKDYIFLLICVYCFFPLIFLLLKNWSNFKLHRETIVLLLGSILTLGFAIFFVWEWLIVMEIV